MSNELDMKADDSEMVEDILNELNNSPENTEVQPPSNIQEQPPVNNVPPVVNTQMSVEESIPVSSNPVIQTQVPVKYDSNDNKINNILVSMKKPIIVVALAFILFHPSTSNVLSRYFPTVFSINESMSVQNVRILCLSLILGLVFLIINMTI